MATMATCSSLFLKALELSKQHPEADFGEFSWGHLAASAEKVWLGACTAAMFRPGEQSSRSGKFERRIESIGGIYGLEWARLEGEYWLFRKGSWKYVALIRDVPRDSPAYHFIRGVLCGVPVDEIDLESHEGEADLP